MSDKPGYIRCSTTETLKNRQPKGFSMVRSFSLHCSMAPFGGFILLYFKHVSIFVNKAYQIRTFYFKQHPYFATIVLIGTILNFFCQYVIWVHFGGGSPISELARCCRRGAATKPLLKILIVERLGGTPITNFVSVYAFLYIGNMTCLSAASALYGLLVYTLNVTHYVRCNNHNREKGELAVHRLEHAWSFKCYSCFLALLTATELVLSCCLSLVLHPVCVLPWLAAQAIARFFETRDIMQGLECIVMPNSYFAFAAPFAKNETCIGLSLLVEILRLISGSLLMWCIDLPRGIADYLPSFVVSVMPSLGRPMGIQVTESKFVDSFTRLSYAKHFLKHFPVSAMDAMAAKDLGTKVFRTVLAAILLVGVLISVIVLMILLCNRKLRNGEHDAADEATEARILEKEEEIEQWCEKRERCLKGTSIMRMVVKDVCDIGDEGFDSSYDQFAEDEGPKCQTCNGQGSYGCLNMGAACNECNGTGIRCNKRCKIEETSVAQGSVPCPDSNYQTCEYCRREFCAYHYFVNNSDAMGSFGGHVCHAAPAVASRQKNAAQAAGAMLGHYLGFW